ncbi:MAG: hypothetical protein IJ225_10545 [Solobacterium sp.]|nr:hypothetical protein [Solobacterium sp.]
MKSYNNLYNKLLDKDYIEERFYNASKRKRRRRDVRNILENISKHIDIVYEMMLNESWQPTRGKRSIINESSSKKIRIIEKPNYAYDQVIHHMFVGVFAPIVMHGFYDFSCGSIPDRGVHYGKKFIQRWIYEYVKRRRRFYVLKLDIRHFYASIDRKRLKEMLRKDIRDDRFYHLACKIIDFDGDLNGKGLPLGFYTSQWLANYYLKRFDHFVKQKLKAQKYMRYVDDMVVFGTNKRELHRMLRAIEEELRDSYELTVKDNWQVFMFEDGRGHGRALDFLGFVFHRDRVTIRKSTLRSARRKANKIWKVGWPTWYSASQMLSHCGWFRHADAYQYFKNHILTKVNIRRLRKVVSKHSRKEAYERLARSYIGRQSKTHRPDDIPDNSLSSQKRPEEKRQG